MQPFSSNIQPKEEKKKKEEEDIVEDIVEDLDEDRGLNLQPELEGIGASASLGVDQSIDTLKLDEYDYMEEIRYYWGKSLFYIQLYIYFNLNFDFSFPVLI